MNTLLHIAFKWAVVCIVSLYVLVYTDLMPYLILTPILEQSWIGKLLK